MLFPALLAAVGLALVHLFAGRLHVSRGVPRSRWLSAGGGVSVAYVFVHLLPELSEGQEALAESVGEVLAFLDHHIYLVALLGLAVFYGLERLAKRRSSEQATDTEVFWIHIGSFALYNALIGYLLLHLEGGLLTLVLYAGAMAPHFLVNDFGLEEHHRVDYERRGRWVLSAAIVGGWALGAAVELPEAALVLLVAFLAGGIMLNVLKEELPEERESRFGAFLLGVSGYTAILLVL